MQFPEVKRKPAKAPYKKPEAVKQLEAMADDEAVRLHPGCPHLASRIFRDDTANALTACIVKYITLNGGFASRISNQGTFNRKLNRFIPGTSRKGLPDVMGTYQGKSLFIEVKIRRDRMSEDQERIKQEQEQSGGVYYVARNFTDFKSWFDQYIIYYRHNEEKKGLPLVTAGKTDSMV